MQTFSAPWAATETVKKREKWNLHSAPLARAAQVGRALAAAAERPLPLTAEEGTVAGFRAAEPDRGLPPRIP